MTIQTTTVLSTPLKAFASWSRFDAARAAVNLGGLAVAMLAAFLVRFDWRLDDFELNVFSSSLLFFVPVQWAVLILADFHRRSIRGVTREDLWRLVGAVSAGTLLGSIVCRAVGVPLPRSVTIIDWLASISILAGIRATICELHDMLRRWNQNGASRCLLVGTCISSEAIVRTVNGSRDSDRRIVGIVAPLEESSLVGRTSSSVPVMGTTDDLERLIARHRIDEVMLVSGTLVGRQVRAIERRCTAAGCRVRIVPVIETLVSGGLHVQPRPLDIGDLLKRESVEIDLDGIGGWLAGETVLVTGAAGSIGSEICRQVARHAPSRIVLVDRNENGLFWMEREMHRDFPDVTCIPCVGDITDATRMEAILREQRASIVFHAAAYKHVPLMEAHPGEAVKNIALASARLAGLAAKHGVDTFVMISTDKAVNPTSVMGACKRLAEMLVRSVAPAAATKFVTVRFGNVLDSAGSVVPLFREQILRGGPVTVTHPEIERFFMTIPEASRLVLQAGFMGVGGEVFVLDMGEPVRIAELARDMIRLSNLVEGRDIEIQYSGLRPGEKLYEELFDMEAESLEPTRHPKIVTARPEPMSLDVPQVIDQLSQIVNTDGYVVRNLLTSLVPSYAPNSSGMVVGRIGPESTHPARRGDAAATVPPKVAA
jgi:FlaA1/EpsC-like NDP-sugar epimerase